MKFLALELLITVALSATTMNRNEQAPTVISNSGSRETGETVQPTPQSKEDIVGSQSYVADLLKIIDSDAETPAQVDGPVVKEQSKVDEKVTINGKQYSNAAEAVNSYEKEKTSTSKLLDPSLLREIRDLQVPDTKTVQLNEVQRVRMLELLDSEIDKN